MFNGFDKSLLSQKAIMLNKYLLKILPGNSEEFYKM